MSRLFCLIFIAFSLSAFAQELFIPVRQNGYTKTTSYDDLTDFLTKLDQSSALLEVEIIGKSVQERNIYGLKFSNSTFGHNPKKIKVLLFAQQHGNEQSGKEGALMLASELLRPENHYLFEKIDLVIVPQVNPDGSEVNQRRNGNNMDLNRNHLILTEPETLALHHLFDKYLFEVSMDVHEYFPYGDTWKNFGYRNNSDIMLGTTTNINVSEQIRELSNQGYLPFMKKYLNERGVSNFIYSPGGPPEIQYIRHSTFDINDGRQSLGIQNTFSFIQEGLNGEDGFIENLEHRTYSQMTGMMGLLEYCCANKNEILNLVHKEREKLIQGSAGKSVSTQNEHIQEKGRKLELPVFSYFSHADSVIIVNDYRPVVASLHEVQKPSGYLIPKKMMELTEWIDRQDILYTTIKLKSSDILEEYQITGIDSIDFEGDIVVNPIVKVNKSDKKVLAEDYIYVPTSQIKGNMIVISLEPKSMLGLVTYSKYAHLLKTGDIYPVLRVTKNKK